MDATCRWSLNAAIWSADFPSDMVIFIKLWDFSISFSTALSVKKMINKYKKNNWYPSSCLYNQVLNEETIRLYRFINWFYLMLIYVYGTAIWLTTKECYESVVK